MSIPPDGRKDEDDGWWEEVEKERAYHQQQQQQQQQQPKSYSTNAAPMKYYTQQYQDQQYSQPPSSDYYRPPVETNEPPPQNEYYQAPRNYYSHESSMKPVGPMGPEKNFNGHTNNFQNYQNSPKHDGRNEKPLSALSDFCKMYDERHNKKKGRKKRGKTRGRRGKTVRDFAGGGGRYFGGKAGPKKWSTPQLQQPEYVPKTEFKEALEKANLDLVTLVKALQVKHATDMENVRRILESMKADYDNQVRKVAQENERLRQNYQGHILLFHSTGQYYSLVKSSITPPMEKKEENNFICKANEVYTFKLHFSIISGFGITQKQENSKIDFSQLRIIVNGETLNIKYESSSDGSVEFPVTFTKVGPNELVVSFRNVKYNVIIDAQ